MNILKHFIDLNTQVAESNVHRKKEYGDWAYFDQYRIFRFIGARGLGSTTFISQIFNPKTDVYVGHSSFNTVDFTARVGNHVCTNEAQVFDDQWRKVRGIIPVGEVKHVFLDIGCSFTRGYQMPALNMILENIYRSFPNAYVIIT